MDVNGRTSVKSFYKGQVIFQEGQESNVAYIILRGLVHIVKDIGGKKTILSSLGKGQIFGEMAVITEGKRMAGAVAGAYCDLILLSRETLERLLDKSPVTVRQLVKRLIARTAATGRQAQGSQTGGAFFNVSTILEACCRLHALTPAEKQRDMPNFKHGLSVTDFSRTAKAMLAVSQVEIDAVLARLYNLRLIEVTNLKPGEETAAFRERFVRIPDLESFRSTVANMLKEIQSVGGEAALPMNYMNLTKFAIKAGGDEEGLFEKLNKGLLPESLLFFRRDAAQRLIEEKGAAFFQSVARRTKSLEELSGPDDLVYVDNATLGKVLQALGYRKVAVLAASAGPEAKTKIFRNLAGKVANVVREEAEGMEADPAEAEDVVAECLDQIRQMKKAPAKEASA